MKVRFQADADLNEIIVKATRRREPGIDIQTAPAAHLAGLNDQEVLTIAAQAGRLLLTHDRKSMPQQFAVSSQQRQAPVCCLFRSICR
jgi:hypothetical protein